MNAAPRVQLKTALIVPCFRPATGWGQRLIERFTAFAKTQPGEVHVCLVHDGTPGGLDIDQLATVQAAIPALTYIDLPTNQGKGFALRAGMAAAPAADVYVYTDIDLPYTLDSMQRVVADVRAHGGVAAGERFEDYYEGVPGFRKGLSRAHRVLMRTAFRLPVSDSQAGLKAFDATGRKIFLETKVNRFLVDLDFIARCRGQVDVRPVQVALRPDITFTDFGIDIVRTEAGNFLRILIASWTRW